MDRASQTKTIWLSPSRLEIAQDCLYKWNGLYGEGAQRVTPSANATAATAEAGAEAAAPPHEGGGEAAVQSEEAATAPHSQALAVGIAAHATLARLFAPGKQEKGKDAVEPVGQEGEGEWEDYLRSLVLASLPSEGEAGRYDEHYVRDTVFNLVKYAYPRVKPAGKVLGVETYMSCKVQIGGYRVQLTCQADRLVLMEDGTLEILDYKTNSRGTVLSPNLLAAHLPSYLYFVTSWHNYRRHPLVRNVVVSQVNLVSLQSSVAHYDQAQIIRNRQCLRECIEALASGPYDPTPNPKCRWCQLRATCPAWQDDQEFNLDDLDDIDEWRRRESA
ncbi:MAG TPA: PD-(D/E)XK nuclease family protein [Chloroflexia bacterium]